MEETNNSAIKFDDENNSDGEEERKSHPTFNEDRARDIDDIGWTISKLDIVQGAVLSINRRTLHTAMSVDRLVQVNNNVVKTVEFKINEQTEWLTERVESKMNEQLYEMTARIKHLVESRVKEEFQKYHSRTTSKKTVTEREGNRTCKSIFNVDEPPRCALIGAKIPDWTS